MYSRKSRGYIPYTPPPDYNGVAFTRDYTPEAILSVKDEIDDPTMNRTQLSRRLTGQQEDPECVTIEEISDSFEHNSDDPENEPEQDVLDADDENTPETEIPADEESSEDQGLPSAIASKEVSLEDVLIIGSVLLFVSGELDGDLMLLLGLLLIAGF